MGKSGQGQAIVIIEIKLIIQCAHARPYLFNKSEYERHFDLCIVESKGFRYFIAFFTVNYIQERKTFFFLIQMKSWTNESKILLCRYVKRYIYLMIFYSHIQDHTLILKTKS